MSRKEENTGFTCSQCGRVVLPISNGSYRNHCPYCLYSRHVDKQPGDRRESCGGLMEPVGLRYKPDKGYQVIHRCLRCGEKRANKVSDSILQPDDIEQIAALLKKGDSISHEQQEDIYG